MVVSGAVFIQELPENHFLSPFPKWFQKPNPPRAAPPGRGAELRLGGG